MSTKKKSNDHVEAVVEHIKPEVCDGIDCDNCECELIADVQEATPETPVVESQPATSDTYTAKEGDTYASIAAAHCPAGMKNFAYATHLFEINGGQAITPNKTVRL